MGGEIKSTHNNQRTINQHETGQYRIDMSENYSGEYSVGRCASKIGKCLNVDGAALLNDEAFEESNKKLDRYTIEYNWKNVHAQKVRVSGRGKM